METFRFLLFGFAGRSERLRLSLGYSSLHRHNYPQPRESRRGKPFEKRWNPTLRLGRRPPCCPGFQSRVSAHRSSIEDFPVPLCSIVGKAFFQKNQLCRYFLPGTRKFSLSLGCSLVGD